MVDETNSHLLNQLILHELNGPPRQPPEQIVQKIQLLDIEFKIGRKLSSSRNPGFKKLFKKKPNNLCFRNDRFSIGYYESPRK